MKLLKQRIEALYDTITAKNILFWLSGDFPEQDKKEITQLLDQNPQYLKELFSTTLVFGTGGLRSPMGIGTNRMNTFTVRRATQGLAQVLRSHQRHVEDMPCVVIGYDTRHHSLEFAHETAKVLAGNGCKALLFKNPEPLALTSFTVRQESATAGVMITASHNPPEYNGYKVYMASGGQILPTLAEEIVKVCAQVETIFSVDSIEDPKIRILGEEYETAYIDTVRKLQLYPADNRRSGKTLHLSYSPLHGTGVSILPRVLKDWGFLLVKLVEEQALPDGDFPTVRLPNPEDPEALALGIKQLMANKDDIFIATDPDTDRVGVVCLDEGLPYRFNGNQIACLLADHILGAWSQQRQLDKEDKIVKSVVTTEMLTAIAQHYHADIVNVETGFKYIGEKIELWRHSPMRFVFGAEESYGYLYGTHVEDKDAIIASAIVAEAALQQKLLGKTLRDALLELYETHGYFANKTESFVFSEQHHKEEMREKLSRFEKQITNFTSLGNYKIEKFENYSKSLGMHMLSGTTYSLELPRTSMLCYYFSGGARIIIRPSGTEPKVKFYFEVVHKYSEPTTDKHLQKQREKESFETLDLFITDFKEKFSTL
ncbi:phospho-sugar mutase [Candidatus Chlamydia sanziniae]|uniref:Phosphomannomutase n=1 Tax=Candidatus Chlamydia sanziniae TaxID=1806891 RepID=A0A1A9HVQ3_9CHLA|nr:phospho-sugar mutase [Candidatus Chlamydia sanziniae]ANH78183.1 Phosphomannomutase [Candidatus Chlamydia sanziniae]